ncbi:MAG: NAD(P)-dependent oxidoreductase [Trueperaceae bacterium]|nr:NAD(P)-dependent oxidoreductase [Trueperaceae bacterium]
MKVAILGDGLLGRTLADALAEDCCEFACYEDPGCTCQGCNTVMLSHSDFDIRYTDSIVAAFRTHQPDVVINTVAVHALMQCEKDPALAFEVNGRGAERVARLVPTVYISTDYVFHDDGPHTEGMPGREPRSVYGRSKLAGELATLEQDGIVVRVAGLFGHFRSHKGPSFPEQVLSGYATMKLPDDQVFSPTYAPDAAERIVDLALALGHRPDTLPLTGTEAKQRVAGIYHAANAGSTTWAAFGEHILNIARHKRHIVPYTAKDKLRPVSSALKSTRLPPLHHWLSAVTRWAIEEGRIPRTSPLR